MHKTDVRDRISQRKYFLARLSKQCLQVYAEHSGQLQISQLASTMSGLPHRYPIIYSLVRIRDIASQLSTYSVCSSKGKIARQLDKASMLARQIAHNTTVELHYLASARHLASSYFYQVPRSPPSLVTFSQLASYLTQLGCFQVVQLGHSLPKQGGKWCSQLAIKLIPGTQGHQAYLSYLALIQAGLSQLAQLALPVCIGWYSAGYRVGTQCSCQLQSIVVVVVV